MCLTEPTVTVPSGASCESPCCIIHVCEVTAALTALIFITFFCANVSQWMWALNSSIVSEQVSLCLFQQSSQQELWIRLWASTGSDPGPTSRWTRELCPCTSVKVHYATFLHVPLSALEVLVVVLTVCYSVMSGLQFPQCPCRCRL